MTHIVNPPPPPLSMVPNLTQKSDSPSHRTHFFQMIFGILSLCSKKHQAKSGEFGQMHKQSLHVYKLVKTNSPFPCLLQLSLHKTEILKQVYICTEGWPILMESSGSFAQ